MFRFTYQLVSAAGSSAEEVTSMLAASGCADAIVSVGTDGTVTFEFVRNATNPESAVSDALEEVATALPSATLLNIAFDDRFLDAGLNSPTRASQAETVSEALKRMQHPLFQRLARVLERSVPDDDFGPFDRR